MEATSSENSLTEEASDHKQQSQTPNLDGQPCRRVKPRSVQQLAANIADTRYPVVKKVIRKMLGFKLLRNLTDIDWDVFWTDNAVQPQQLASMKVHQKINHFPGMYTLSRKNYLARNLAKMSKQFPDDYDFYPHTWVLPSELNDLRIYLQEQNNAVVIAKPEASCQGRGIFLSKSIDDFDFGEHYVVQKYMKKPFLIDGLKFDLRVYVLVAGCDPLRTYIYKEGLARFATEAYSLPKKENLTNMFMHLTNYAINKNNSKFEFNASSTEMDKGHKRSLTSILRKLQEMGHNSGQIWKNIGEIITKTLISVQPILSHHYRSCQPQNYANNMCFEVLGFDVILDTALKPYILEVNYTPSFTTDTPLDKLIKENLIKDTLILMNISHKAKAETLKTKKKEIMERTLTGKKVWHSKGQREELIEMWRIKRDLWQNSHLGNFQKIFPSQDVVTGERYSKYLSFSEQCYLSITGANIKRNQKIMIASEKQFQGLKPNKAEQLEKIYIKKQKPFHPSRTLMRNSGLHQSRPAVQSFQEKTEGAQLPYHTCQQHISRLLPYRKHDNPILARKAYLTQKMIDEKQLRRADSAKNRKAISKVYNITFKEMQKK